jgi:mono/diheme cytochrome c family protein
MPRIKADDGTGATRIFVNHNQNDNLRPGEKMIRSVCSDCHGLQFSLDALADKQLALGNYTGRPEVRVQSIHWAKRRQQTRK